MTKYRRLDDICNIAAACAVSQFVSGPCSLYASQKRVHPRLDLAEPEAGRLKACFRDKKKAKVPPHGNFRMGRRFCFGFISDFHTPRLSAEGFLVYDHLASRLARGTILPVCFI